MGEKKLRDSRIELLRIISMFLIVLSHFSVFGNWSNKSSLTALQTTRALLFDALGPAAAICFFLITGYFSNKAGRQIKIQVKKVQIKLKVSGHKPYFIRSVLVYYYMLFKSCH